MKKLIIALVVLVVLIAASVFGYNYLSPRYTPDENKAKDSTQNIEKAVDFTVKDASGSDVKLSDYFGKPTVINFWATWCGPCRSELPAFEKLYLDFGDSLNFLMVNLTDGSNDTVPGVKEFTLENGYTFPVFFDTSGKAADAYGVYSIPMTVFIDADGRIVNTHTGAMNEPTLTDYIKSLLGEN